MTKHHDASLRNERGSMLITVMIAVGIVSLLSLVWASMLRASQQESFRINAHLSATIVRANIQALLENNTAWDHTMAANASLQCLDDGADCSVRKNQENPITILKNSANEVIFDESVATAGFRSNGAPCNGFNAAMGSWECPFRIRIYWKPVCGATCSGQPAQVFAELIYKHSNQHPFNTGNYGILVTK